MKLFFHQLFTSLFGKIVAVAMVYFGVTRMDRCPAEPMVPIFLIGKIIGYAVILNGNVYEQGMPTNARLPDDTNSFF